MEFIKQNIFLIVLAAVSGAMLIAEAFRGRGSAGLSAVDATLLINRENAIVIDLRDTADFSAGHLPNARNIPLAELEKRTAELGKSKIRPLVFVCQNGAHSGKALALITKAGFEKAYSLGGGIAAWEKEGYPLVKEKA